VLGRCVNHKHIYKICVVYVLAVENMTMVPNFEVTYVTMNVLGIAAGVNYHRKGQIIFHN
jgi:hypothetical protein